MKNFKVRSNFNAMKEEVAFENEKSLAGWRPLKKKSDTSASKVSEEALEERDKYIAFMYNPQNSHNCENCPANEGFDNWQGRKPCGQFNCWVDCHCNS